MVGSAPAPSRFSPGWGGEQTLNQGMGERACATPEIKPGLPATSAPSPPWTASACPKDPSTIPSCRVGCPRCRRSNTLREARLPWRREQWRIAPGANWQLAKALSRKACPRDLQIWQICARAGPHAWRSPDPCGSGVRQRSRGDLPNSQVLQSSTECRQNAC